MKIGDRVIDLTALREGFTDWIGTIANIDGSMVLVLYDSAVERWKKSINIKGLNDYQNAIY